jgi:hypothetical protein
VDELEQSLRRLLTDERLDVPVRPGAVGTVHDGVRRRRAAGRAVLAVSAVVAVLFGATVAVAGNGLPHKAKIALGVDDDPTQKSTPTSQVSPSPTVTKSPSPQRIAWNPRPYGEQRLTAIRASLIDPTMQSCTTEQLDMSARQGASGGVILDARNTGPRCFLQDPPTIEGFDGEGNLITRAAPRDEFAIPTVLTLEPNSAAYTGFAVNSHGPSCQIGVQHLRVGLGDPGEANEFDVEIAAEWFEPYKECGTTPVSTQDPYVVTVGSGWVPVDRDRRDPDGGLDADMRASASVMAGTFLNYDVRVNRDVAGSSPCQPFRERLRAYAGEVLAEQSYLLPCREIRAASTETVILEMQLYIPTDVAAETYILDWDTATVDAAEKPVRVATAPPDCQQDQLRFSNGRGGAAAGTYYNAVVFMNVSDTACSLYGYPGVEFVGLDGRHLRTKPEHMTDVARQSVVLAANGGTATARLGSSPAPDSDGACEEVRGVDVIAPGLTRQVLVRDVASYCSNGRLLVWPVVSR